MQEGQLQCVGNAQRTTHNLAQQVLKLARVLDHKANAIADSIDFADSPEGDDGIRDVPQNVNEVLSFAISVLQQTENALTRAGNSLGKSPEQEKVVKGLVDAVQPARIPSKYPPSNF